MKTINLEPEEWRIIGATQDQYGQIHYAVGSDRFNGIWIWADEEDGIHADEVARRKADAISAVPHLIAALARLVGMFDNGNAVLNPGLEDDREAGMAFLDKARAAIAKARGQE